MVTKKPDSKKPGSKLTVSKKTIKDLKLKPGKEGGVQGGSASVGYAPPAYKWR